MIKITKQKKEFQAVVYVEVLVKMEDPEVKAIRFYIIKEANELAFTLLVILL